MTVFRAISRPTNTSQNLDLQCPICDAPFLRCDADEGTGPILKCTDCRHIVLNEDGFWDARPSKEVHAEFSKLWTLYEQGKFGSQPKMTPETDRALLIGFLEKLGIQPEELAGLRILDVGYGSGRLLQELQKHSPAAYGIDLGKPLLSSQLNRENVFIGDLHSCPFKAGQFDIVVCKGVIQHTEDPFRAFSSIGDNVSDGGKLYLETFEKGMRKTRMLRMLLPFTWRYPDHIRLVAAGLASTVIALFKTVPELKNGFAAALKELGRHRLNYMLWIYDDLCCRWSHSLHVDEIMSWFRKKGFVATRLAPGRYVGVKYPSPGYQEST